MNIYKVIGIITLMVLSHVALVGAAEKSEQQLTPVDARYHTVLHGGVVGAGHAKVDTAYLLGGPGGDDGDFQDIDGAPSWDGWTSVDLTFNDSWWTVDTYNAQNLDPNTVPNQAWWCGKNWTHDCGTGDFAGYGDDWNTSLGWTGTVTNPSLSTIVTVRCVLNYDIESSSDYLYLRHETASQGWVEDAFFTGSSTAEHVDVSWTVDPSDYTDGNQIHLRWNVTSDGGWSDQSCDSPSMGAAQIDSIEVYFDQGPDDPQLQGTVEDCDTHDTQWEPEIEVDGTVGDFAKVWPLLNDVDVCISNNTPVVAFIDDGDVVPGTGGYVGISWTYGPGGYIVNPEGGLAGPEYHLQNEIWSPVITWSDQTLESAILTFDYFVHEPFSASSAGIGMIWRIRSVDGGDPGAIADAQWQNDNFGYFFGPYWRNFSVDVSEYLVPGRTHVQIALGAFEAGWIWGYNGTDASPAPYFDNVAFKIFNHDGPIISANETDLAQDSFPEIGDIDLVDLSNNSVRFDSASEGVGQSSLGPAIVFTATPGPVGSNLIVPPRLFYRLSANPVFDAYRSDFPSSGDVPADQALDENGDPIPNQWAVDLPDASFFFPGDVIHYFFRAEDNLDNVTHLPADTTDFEKFSPTSLYPGSFTVRALPTINEDGLGGYEQPPILLINDNANRGGEDEWRTSMNNLGYFTGDHYDLYSVQAPAEGLGNGIGGRATAAQLAGYETIIYSCGDLSSNTISNGDQVNGDPGNDIGVLLSWLAQDADRSMLLTGDDLAADLSQSGAETQDLLTNWMGVNYLDWDVRPYVGGQVAPSVHSLFIPDFQTDFIAYGGCDGINDFDAVAPVSPAVTTHEFLDPAGVPYGSVAAGIAHDFVDGSGYRKLLVSLPYDFMFIDSRMTKSPVPSAARTRFLEDFIIYSNSVPGSGVLDGVPDLTLSSAVSAAAGQVVSVFTRPDGGGDQLRNARHWDGVVGNPPTRVDATITVTLLDGSDPPVPVPNYPAEDTWLETDSGGLILCPGGSIADANTNVLGQTTFSRSLAGWGHTDVTSELTQVMVSGSALNQPALDIRFNTPDINGDHIINWADASEFATDLLFGPTGDVVYRSDFYYDGLINLSDMVLFTLGYFAECRGEGALVSKVEDDQDTSEGSVHIPAKQLPTASIGVYADSVGTQRIQYIPRFEQFNVYVLLFSDAPVGIGGAAWKLAYSGDPSELIYVSDTYGSEFNFVGQSPAGIFFGSNECGDGHPGVPVMLSEVQFLNLNPLTGIYEIDVLPNPNAGLDLVYADCQGRLSTSVTGSKGYLAYGVNAIDINPEPDSLSPPAPWYLTGPNDYEFDGSTLGDEVLSSLNDGDYTITWGIVAGYNTPRSQTRYLGNQQAFTLTGKYTPEGEVGSVAINASPETVTAVWHLSGPNSYELDGNGNDFLSDRDTGEYKLTWEPAPGMADPVPQEVVLWVAADEITTFTATYRELVTVNVNVTPDGLGDTTWHLTGPSGFDQSGADDVTLTDLLPGDYTLTWQDVPGWLTPDPIQESQTADPGGTITFSGTYIELGTIVVDATPDNIGASWQLLNTDTGYTFGGAGDEAFADQEPGNYLITWNDAVVVGWVTPTNDFQELSEGGTINFSGVYFGDIPTITAVEDVGNDQGGQVRLLWTRSVFDLPGDGIDITGYEVYRRQDEFKSSGLSGGDGFGKLEGRGAKNDHAKQVTLTVPDDPQPQSFSGEKILGWDFLTTVPAHGDLLYGSVVPTLCDSTADGVCLSTFRLRAITPDPFDYYESLPASGYSVDNQAPLPPLGFLVSDVDGGGNVQLDWQESGDEDFRYFSLNQGTDPDFVPDAGNRLIQLTGNSYNHPGAVLPGQGTTYYKLAATDFAGNVGQSALVGISLADTPIGQDVPVDAGSGLNLTFGEVTSPGVTEVSVETSGPALPAEFQLTSDPPLFYNITTTAVFSGTVELCFLYDDTDLGAYESALVLLHYDESIPPGQYFDITSSLDTDQNVICGQTTTLSPFVLAISVSGPPPLGGGIVSAQVITGNPSGPTTGIALSWSAPPPGYTVSVYRKGFSNYPEYDDGTSPGSVPTTPTDPATAVAEGWTPVSETSETSLVDYPPERDFWYYVGFVGDGLGNYSVPSSLSDGTLDYHLGDVSRVSVPSDPSDPFTGDNQVQIEDVTSLASAYGTADGATSYRADVDFGPTHDGTLHGRPTTDDEIEFEDLILLSINFSNVNKETAPPPPASRNLLVLEVPELPDVGQTFSVALRLMGDGSIQGLSVPLVWDSSAVQPVSMVSGDLLADQGEGNLILSPRLGTVDAALLGIRDWGICGEGTLATLQYRVIGGGDPAFGFDMIEVRDAANGELALETEVRAEFSGPSELPKVSALHPNYPNPFNPLTHIRFDLDREQAVRLTVFSVEGKLVTTLVAGQLPAGRHEVQWDGRNDRGHRLASGMYFYRLETGSDQFTRRMMLVK